MQGVSGSSPLGSIFLDSLQCKEFFIGQGVARPGGAKKRKTEASDAALQGLLQFCASQCAVSSATTGDTGKRRTLYVDVEGFASHLRSK